MDDAAGPMGVLRAKAQTIVAERARLAGCLLSMCGAAGYRATRAAMDAEWQRLVANDPRRAEDEGFVG